MMASESPPADDGLTVEHRVLFALFVRWFVRSDGCAPVREVLGWSQAQESARYGGEVAFASHELTSIVETLADLPNHPTPPDSDLDFLNVVRDKLARDKREYAGWVRDQICDTRGDFGRSTLVEPLANDGTQAALDTQDPSARLTDIMLDPEQAKVLLPAAVFGFVVGLPVLRHLQPFIESTSLSTTWLLILGVGLWSILNVLGLDRLMQWTIRRGVRRLPKIANVHKDFEERLESASGADRHRPQLRAKAIASLRGREERSGVEQLLAKVDTCERLAVWMLVAAPLTYLALIDTTWPRWVYPSVVLVAGLTLLPSAIDHLRRASQFFPPAGSSRAGSST